MTFRITRYQQHPNHLIAAQVIDLAVANLTDISLVGVPPSNHLYEVYCLAMGAEIGIYIQHIGSEGDLKVELVVATDDEGGVVGFLMYLPVVGCPDACGVTYMAVSARHRRKGIARSMVSEMLARFPHAGLSCAIEKVPFYEKLGFQVLDHRANQIHMNTRDYVAPGLMGTLDVQSIYESEEVEHLKASIARKYGVRALSDASKQLARSVERGQVRAEKFVREHLAKRNASGC